MKKTMTRRGFLGNAGMAALVATGAAATLANKALLAEDGVKAPADTKKEAAAKKLEEAGVTCGDLSSLTDADKGMRTALQYVDNTPDAAKDCSGCQLFLPVAEGKVCGGCPLLKGPISPKGWCASWVAKQG